MFEIKHLKTLSTLAATGNIRKTAEKLFVSQSALSHQIKDLEQRLNTPLFIRNTSPVQFTAQGNMLLTLANTILPKIKETMSELKGKNETTVQLKIAIACHACFQWLLPVTEQFSKQYPALKIEFLEQVFPAQNHDEFADNIDILFTDEKKENDNFSYHELGAFEVVAVLANRDTIDSAGLINKEFLEATDFSKQVLLTNPVKSDQLDIFKLFLHKESNRADAHKHNKHQGITIKQVANSHMILQMVAANMGIAVLPIWLVSSLSKQSLVQTKRIGKAGIYKTLYARYNTHNVKVDIIKQLIPQTIAAFSHLNINNSKH